MVNQPIVVLSVQCLKRLGDNGQLWERILIIALTSHMFGNCK